jgi:hypothetical protein
VQDKSQSEIDKLLDLELMRKHEAESGGRPFNPEEIYQDANANQDNNVPRQYTF